jgi:hypothetical protein
MAAKWNFVVLVSLEFWLADNGDLAADYATLALDRAAAAKHISRYHHSRRVQRGWLYRRGKRHLGEVPAAAAKLPLGAVAIFGGLVDLFTSHKCANFFSSWGYHPD